MAKAPISQLKLFEALHNSRLEDYNTFKKKDYRGIWSSIIDKYPETAHFVYELLQNADDAGATESYISVNYNELLFKHNGTKHFDITEENAENTGDINSITGIGNSSKDDLSNKIGKFGVGFKAVFQYTDTPEIYDDTFKFKIENFIVPCLIEQDHPQRKAGETLFVFPFKQPKKAFEEITSRLEQLENPILFLRNLNKIKLRIKHGSSFKEYEYSKTVIEHIDYDKGLSLDRYSIHEPSKNSSIFLFSQKIVVTEGEENRTEHLICVGFFYDDENQCLITDSIQNIYCFFPTKETFNTCFISHAPFLLTDNRQNLKPGENLNQSLVNLLAELASNAVVKLRDYGKEHKHFLIDENIVNIIPYYGGSWHYFNKLFEEPIKDAFDDLIREEALLLSRNGRYLKLQEAFISSPKELSDLLSVKQFNELRRGLGKLDFLKWELSVLIDKSDSDTYNGVERYTSEDLAEDITASFMDHQEMKWVIKFYNYLRANASSLWKVIPSYGKQTLSFRSSPIVKTQKGKWVAPYIDFFSPNVYFPQRGQTGKYNFIHNDYLQNEHAKKFFNELELKTPDEIDYIRTVILEKYKGDEVSIEDEDLLSDMRFLLGYYQRNKESQQFEEIVSLLSDNFYLVSTDDCLVKPNKLYFQDNRIEQYFGKDNQNLLNTEYYKPVFDEYGLLIFETFVSLIGVHRYPLLKKLKYSSDSYWYNERIRNELSLYSYAVYEISDYELEGFATAVSEHMSKEMSLYLWNEVLPHIRYSYYEYLTISFRRKRSKHFENGSYCSSFKYELLNEPWIYDGEGNCYSAKEIALEDLDSEYARHNGLIQFLGIEKREKSIIELGGTEQQQEEQNLGKEINDIIGNYLSKEEAKKILSEVVARKRGENMSDYMDKNLNSSKNVLNENNDEGGDDLDTKLQKKWDKKANEDNKRPHSQSKGQDVEPYINNHSQEPSNSNQPFFEKPSEPHFGKKNDEDSLKSRVSTNLKKKNTEAQENAKQTSEQMKILEKLEQTEKYTFLWYKLLMELMHADKSKTSNRNSQIDFSEWSFECSNKILRLSNPSRPVPSWLCDAKTITVSTISAHPDKIDCEVVKTDERSVDLLVEFTDELQKVCSISKKIRIVAEDSSNIIDSLERRFLQLGYEDDFNLNDNLPADIQFIYGPPGTGKTTKLVSIIHDIVNNRNSKTNILILTPTNKAADVIAEKLVGDDVCYTYLARYGATESLFLIEEAAVVLNRDSMDMDLLDSNIMVTTAARYSYDCVQPDNTFICDYPWDYIIVDEASMIDIITITYILHKGTDAKFIVAGDPKQIQPVPQNDIPSLNIYDMVGLCDFASAINNFKRYPVTALTTQYRSIPSIGELVSSFAYNGIVKPDPNRTPQKPLELDGIKVNDINFMGFDIVDLDLIKGLNSVGDSAFHLYSVIYTYNLAEYMSNQIQKRYKDSLYSIGIVCPYKQQADAIGQMLDNRPIDNDNCHVTCGTVHSFQGDECDIMLVVLNPPMNCSSGSHINNANILNVAMSRARDYLFFILPKGQPNGFFQKNVIGHCVGIANRSIVDCSKIEETIFGSEDYIGSNTHVTCHMPVNVYKDSNAQYEVRISDDAIDIKINR